jgi:hypothetical protein
MVVLRTSTRSSSREDFVSISILVPAPPPPSAALNRQRPPTTNQIGPITPIEPLIVPPPEISLPNAPSTSIDWDAEASRAAAAITETPKYREFGRAPKGVIEPPRHSPEAHRAGDQYRDIDGWVVWVSDRCYIVPGVRPLGMPDVIAREIPVTTVCRDNSRNNAEFFKSNQLP